MDTILGLPIHPLLVHAPVIAVPTFAIGAICYAVIPRVRQRIGWIVMALSVIAPLSTLGAWWSGHRFYDMHVEMISGAGSDPAMFQKLLAAHLAYGDILVWLVPGATLAVWGFGYLSRRASTSGEQAPGFVKPLMIVTAVLVVGLCGASGWYTFQSGHSGAEVVWGQEKK